MKASVYVLLISGWFVLGISFSAEQTNWSGGPSPWGPVTSFGTDFCLDTDVRWLTTDETLISGFYDTETLIKANQHSYRVMAADLDLDGNQDLLYSAAVPDVIGACYNQSSGSSWQLFTLFSGSMYIEWFGVADINGDGYPDVTGTQWGNVIWLENPGVPQGNWNVHAVPYTLSCNIGLPADMDGDGDVDLVGRTNMYTLRWYENLDGTGDLWEEKLITTVNNITFYSMGDINGDGLCDVAATRNSTGDVIWFEHPQPGSDDWIYHEITTSFNRPSQIVTLDIDGDGDLDIAVSSYPYSYLAIFENVDGAGNLWSQRFVSSDVEQINQLTSVDYDLDGDYDLLAGTFGDGAKLFENMDGTGNTWFEYSFQSCGYNSRGAFSEDFNGDGMLDFAFGGTGSDNRLKWCTLDYVTGSLESNLLDTEVAADWGSISWTGAESASTAIGFQVRSSNSSEIGQMPAWSDTLWDPCSLDGILTEGHRYVQYRVILLTDDPANTATLEDVVISWNSTGIASENTAAAVQPSFTLDSNPSKGQAVVFYSLDKPSPVVISLFDICGRLQQEYANESMPTGAHTTCFSDLTPGVYCLRFTASGSTGFARITVIE